MNNKEKTALVPKLRFPEFFTTGEWLPKTLNDLADRVTSRNKDNSVNRVLTNSAIKGVVDQSDYFDKKVANPNNLDNYFVIDENDYVYNPRISVTAPVGPISKNKIGKGVMSPLYTVFRFKNHMNDFYEQYFKTSLWHNYLKSVANKGARHDRISISNDIFMKMPLPYPSEDEQEKVANCLSSLDDLITAEAKKLNELKDHKKGLMQKLFPAEGKTVPEWRFPEFKGSGKWVENSLGDIGEIITGNTPLTSKQEYYNGAFLFVSPADISDKRYIDSTKTTLTKIGFEQTRHIDEYSILYVCIGSTIGKIAQNKIKCATNQQINSIIPSSFFSNSYIYYALDFVGKSVINLAGKQAVPIINKTLFSKIIIKVPTNKKEQDKIAACLSELDKLITAQAEKIEALKLHKKGLMQGLFPSFEEVDI